ncbi:MAG: hypothetical protein Q7O66_04380 [Dehalococcoidia bacterium]|nr:hypothetical protein [Dehalococcoidia bacterium]
MEIRAKAAQQQKLGKETPKGEDLRQFTLDLLRAIGALVEVEESGVVDVVLPPANGRPMMLGQSDGDFLRLAFDQGTAANHPDAQFLALGSPLTDQLIQLAEGVGLATRYYVNGLKWSSRVAVDFGKWKARVVNGRFVPEGIDFPFACHYVLFDFVVSYISDEKREELRTVIVDSSSLHPGNRLQQAWNKIQISPRREFVVADFDALPGLARLDTVYRRAAVVLERQIADTIVAYRRRTNRHLELENLRINTFYDDTIEELKRRAGRADSDERRQAIEGKIEASDLERRSKIADIAAKHKLRVVFSLLNAAIITQPKVRSKVRVENRYAATDLYMVFDPLTGEMELPVCQVCSEATEVIHLCANGHVVCPECITACGACKREYCVTCGMVTCSVCGKPVCSHSEVRCPVCGRITCPDDKGKCHGSE